jgi:hypothetical protein
MLDFHLNHFIKIFSIFLLLTPSLFGVSNEYLTKTEIIKLIELKIQENNVLEIKKNKKKNDFKKKLITKTFKQNISLQKKVKGYPDFLQEKYCDYMLNINKFENHKNSELLLFCSDIFRTINLDKSISLIEDIYYHYDYNNNKLLLSKLSKLYLLNGDLDKYNKIKQILK